MKRLFTFEFWQQFGKALMVVIAVMPAAGLMISIGKTIPCLLKILVFSHYGRRVRVNWLGHYW